ncbi:putative ABC transporter [Protomyces lactucae-debilis]|uniref:Putative ABC transporter n=1 Tax=Protomyces lactucae-debilis TaxID=2754530 RepID=A0A1Y2FUY0_PROLT|nr:putative ABC transporter [Protomyces lactucae-debilis]ORY87802.1 putative ABC transporter [Protomyces lactucae-debilis]
MALSLANDLSPSNAFPAYFAGRPDQCPPCFNCLLPAFQCKQFAPCNEYNGACDCPPGFGGNDCIEPTCGSLADGKNRHVRKGKDCDCSDGWSGLNCNVCETDEACNPLMPEQLNGTCYKGGLVVHQNFQMCDVTNRKIVDQLKDKKPQVTFSCKADDRTCNFQFWVDRVESFYCALDDCEFSQNIQFDSNSTDYKCKDIKCSCIPDRMLCGEDGSIDISDFLSEEIKGPGSFSCSSKTKSCTFEEPAMNELISDVFGDKSIQLDCNASECLHYTEIPGFQRPAKPSNAGLIAGSVAGAAILLGLLALILWLTARRSQQTDKLGAIRLTDDESAQLLANHTPATLQFRKVCYEVNGKGILQDVRGNVGPGQVLAILGASGAGKTSFLDILARKNKRGKATGEFLVNGRSVEDHKYKDVVGFVDQEDALMPTLTVYETVLYSALLRLPRDMTAEAKRLRVYETLEELGILHIKDSLIGQEGNRGISGGEKRRVSIACELVTSPSILFLDEPTSGLDSFNAFNVAECLTNLARGYNRTIIMTIHQPRSNIVALFDQLILLARGRVVYSGELSACQTHFESIGLACPTGYNIADYLIDLTMNTTGASQIVSPQDSSTPINNEPGTSVHNGEPHSLERCNSVGNESNAWGEVRPRQRISRATQQRDLFGGSTDLNDLFKRYNDSGVAASIDERIKESIDEASDRPVEMASPLGRGYARIGWFAQFVLLSKRTFKNLYRNPMLLLTHYAIAVLLALLCGYLYFRISNDLSGFQGRLGLFFFILSLFGFSTLTSLNLLVMERTIFMRERANGYYAPITYFMAKVMFDIIPLRVLPPIIMGLIIYPTVGLVPEGAVFARFLLILVLFNVASASVCLLIGITVKEPSIANLVGSLFMLFSLLFAGLLLNHDSIPGPVRFLQKLSIFHYAYEALLVNEVTYLTLTEKKFGLSIDVPGATILSTFGFNAQAFSADLLGLTVYFGVFLTLSFAAMHFLLVEKR